LFLLRQHFHVIGEPFEQHGPHAGKSIRKRIESRGDHCERAGNDQAIRARLTPACSALSYSDEF